MRKLLILIASLAFAALLLAVAPIMGQANPPFYGVIAGSTVTNSDFSAWKGGIDVGLAIPIDGERLALSGLYKKAEFGNKTLQSVRVSLLLSWYVGKKWRIYVPVGGDAPLTEDTQGDYFSGLGVSRRIFTANDPDYLVPLSIDGFVHFTTADPSGEGSNINQITIGILVSKPVRR